MKRAGGPIESPIPEKRQKTEAKPSPPAKPLKIEPSLITTPPKDVFIAEEQKPFVGKGKGEAKPPVASKEPAVDLMELEHPRGVKRPLEPGPEQGPPAKRPRTTGETAARIAAQGVVPATIAGGSLVPLVLTWASIGAPTILTGGLAALGLGGAALTSWGAKKLIDRFAYQEEGRTAKNQALEQAKLKEQTSQAQIAKLEKAVQNSEKATEAERQQLKDELDKTKSDLEKAKAAEPHWMRPTKQVEYKETKKPKK